LILATSNSKTESGKKYTAHHTRIGRSSIELYFQSSIRTPAGTPRRYRNGNF
jgi:hypothetical protein